MDTTSGKTRVLPIALWAAQIFLAIAFAVFGSMKATVSLDQLAGAMKWVPTVAPGFVRALGVAEILGAVGLILPSIARIQPRLTVAAAICLAILQVIAICLHATRGETAQTIGLNIILLGLAVFVAWGRSVKAPISPKAKSQA